MAERSEYWGAHWAKRRRLTRRRILATGVSLGSASLITAACGSGDDDDDGGASENTPQSNVGATPAKTPKRGGTLTVRVVNDPPNWSPFTASTYTAAFANNVYSKLIRRKVAPDVDPADIVLEADLATALPESPDPETFVFTLRPGVKFQDVDPVNGRELTADDVKIAIDAYRGDTRAAMKADYAAIDSVEAVDTLTVTVKLKEPFVPLLGLSAGHYGWRIFPKELINGDDLKSKAVGTGPFILEDYQPSNRATYRRNPDYFKDGLPYLDNLTLIIIPQDASAIAAFQAGQANVIGGIDCTSAGQVRSQKKDARFQQVYSAFPGGYIALDTTKSPFSDVRVRRALSMAFNRKAESDALECGEGKPDQLIPTGAYKKALPIEALGEAARYWEYNPEEAKRLLAEAGFSDGLEVPLYYTPQYGQSYMNSTERALSDFAAAGIRAKPTAVQYNEWIGGMYRPPFNFEGLLWGPSRYYTDVDPYLWYWLHPDPKQGISNQSRVNDPDLLPLLQKQRRTLDETERLQVVGEIQKIVADQQYYIGRTTGNSYAFWEPWVEGWAFNLGYDLPQAETAWDSRLA